MKPKYEALNAMTEKETKVLDHGFVRLVDYMGDDSSIVQAARVSYGEGTKTSSDDRSLIRYLMRHRHTTPFEMCEIKLHLKLPIFVARQWMRHRMSSYNEVSGRYSVMKDEFYVPEVDRFTRQSVSNNQGSSNEIIDGALEFRGDRYIRSSNAFTAYERELEAGLSREVARTELPLSTYTEFYWKIDLHNLLHFLQLRLDKHAQYEIRVYAEAIAEIVKLWVPIAWEAFVDYRLEAVTLSRMEIGILRSLIEYYDIEDIRALSSKEDSLFSDYQMEKIGMSKREINEFLSRFK